MCLKLIIRKKGDLIKRLMKETHIKFNALTLSAAPGGRLSTDVDRDHKRLLCSDFRY